MSKQNSNYQNIESKTELLELYDIPTFDDVVSSAALVGVTNLIFALHLVYSIPISLLLLLHELPPLEISLIFLNPTRINHLLLVLIPLFSLHFLDGSKVTNKPI